MKIRIFRHIRFSSEIAFCLESSLPPVNTIEDGHHGAKDHVGLPHFHCSLHGRRSNDHKDFFLFNKKQHYQLHRLCSNRDRGNLSWQRHHHLHSDLHPDRNKILQYEPVINFVNVFLFVFRL